MIPNTIKIVVCSPAYSGLAFETVWNFFPNIFSPQLVESVDAELTGNKFDYY